MKKRFPSHLQFDETDCGVTCIKIILDYYNLDIPLSLIKEKCFTDLQGANILEISNTLKYFNFETVVVKASIEQLKESPLPAILLFENNHYVVLYKITKKGFYISDPEFGKYILDNKLFAKRWIEANQKKRGVGIFFEPKKNFNKSNTKEKNNSKLKKIFYKQYIKGNLKSFFIILFISALLALSNLAFPILTKKIVDEAIPYSNYSLIGMILIIQVTIILFGNFFNFINDKLFVRITSKLNIDTLSHFLEKLSKIPFKFFELRNVSDIIQRIGDHSRIEGFITDNISTTVYSIISVFSFLILLIQYNIFVFLIFIFSFIFSFFWTFSFNSKRNLIEYKRFSSYKSGMGSSFEIVQGMVELKLNNAEDYRIQEWRKKQKKIYSIKEESLILENKINIGNILISQLKNATVTFICAYLVIQKSLTLGEMLSISYIIGALNSPLTAFLTFIKKWNETKFSFARINDINEMSEEDRYDSKEIKQFKKISVNGIDFKYNENSNDNILENIVLEIKRGQKIAFVGQSGSGKTTLMKVLLKFYNPLKGSINIDNLDLKEINAKNWRKLCGVVMQDGYIFSGSILDNIILDKTEINYEWLKYVCELANIRDYIENLPKKYDTILGQNGQGMSGGQIQRILIARALYKDPKILIFDEATSSLDTYNENTIMNNIYTKLKDKTMIVIAHRLSTIRDVDIIYVFSNGKIVEYGTHKELVDIKKTYYNLVKKQL